MQNTSAKSSGRISTPAAGSESHGEHSEEPLMVTQEAIEAYEKRTGFYGIGKIMVEDGHWVIVTKEELAKSKARAQANRTMTIRQRGIA